MWFFVFKQITNTKQTLTLQTNKQTNKQTPQALHDHISYNTLFCQYEIRENKIDFFQKPLHKRELSS